MTEKDVTPSGQRLEEGDITYPPKVLVIDCPSSRGFLSYQDYYRVIEESASSLDEARRKMKTFLPDIVIFDPTFQKDSYTPQQEESWRIFLEEVKSNNSRIQLLLTAHNLGAINLTTDGQLQKPVDINQVATKLRELGVRIQVIDQLY